MNAYELCQETLDSLYIGLLGWIGRWVPAPHSDTLAATCMAHLVRDAMVGQPTAYGPYRLVYQSAEFQMRWWSQANGYVVPFGIWRTIPLPLPEQLCDIARAYAAIYQATELAQVSIPEQNMLAEMMERARYDVEGYWRMPPLHPDIPVISGILDRAVRTLDTHVCATHNECREFEDLWQREDVRGGRWLADYRHHYRENVHG